MEKTLIGEGVTALVFLNGEGLVEKIAKPKMWGYLEKEIPAYMIIGSRKHFPKLHRYNKSSGILVLSYCGEAISCSNVPADWREQVDEIGGSLKEMKIFHNDIRGANISVKDGEIFLIDMGHWSKKRTVTEPDRQSMIKVIEAIISGGGILSRMPNRA